MHASKLLLMTAATLAAGGTMASAGTQPVIGWIEIVPAGKGLIDVVGHVSATADTKGRYALSLDRKSHGNSAKTGQSGAFSAGAGESVVLSKTGINVVAGEELTVELTLSVDGKDVYVATLRPLPDAN